MSNKKLAILGSIVVISCIGLISYFTIASSVKESKHLETVSLQQASEIAKTPGSIIVVGRTSCSHCVQYKPQLFKYAEDNNTKIYYIDLDKSENSNYSLFPQFKVIGTPSTLFFKDGAKVHSIEGYVTTATLSKNVEIARKKGFILKRGEI